VGLHHPAGSSAEGRALNGPRTAASSTLSNKGGTDRPREDMGCVWREKGWWWRKGGKVLPSGKACMFAM